MVSLLLFKWLCKSSSCPKHPPRVSGGGKLACFAISWQAQQSLDLTKVFVQEDRITKEYAIEDKEID